MSGEPCRDFEKGDCRRGPRCKFSHPTLRICRDFQNKKCDRENCRFLHVTRDEEETYTNSGVLPDHLDEEEVRQNKVMTPSYGNGGGGGGGGDGGFQDFIGYGKRRRDDGFNLAPSIPPGIPPVLMQENDLLKQKVNELQRQVMDLRQMNDTLYEQNTRYRNQLRGTPVQQPVAGNMAAVGTHYMDFNNKVH